MAHFHNCGLDEAQAHDVAADAAHRDPVADGERVATKDDEIPGDRCHHLLQRKGEARRDQSEGRRKPRRVAEPDRQNTKDQDHGRDQADALASPEFCLNGGRFRPADEQPGQGSQDAACCQQDSDEEDGE